MTCRYCEQGRCTKHVSSTGASVPVSACRFCEQGRCTKHVSSAGASVPVSACRFCEQGRCTKHVSSAGASVPVSACRFCEQGRCTKHVSSAGASVPVSACRFCEQGRCTKHVSSDHGKFDKFSTDDDFPELNDYDNEQYLKDCAEQVAYQEASNALEELRKTNPELADQMDLLIRNAYNLGLYDGSQNGNDTDSNNNVINDEDTD